MDFSSNKRLSVNEAKKIGLVSFLSGLGYEPEKIRNNDYWYCSPLREEKTPSFKVNCKMNLWYDHGLGKGGNLIDFGIEYYHCTIGELLHNLSNNFSFQQPIVKMDRIATQSPSAIEEQGKQIKIIHDAVLSSFALLRYLKQRHIPLEIADRYCREISYKVNGKIYYGIGFKNDLGGFEIRNPYFKASSSPKGITTLDNGAKEVIVFEGFMDFLSFKTVHKSESEKRFDFVVLNSISLFDLARSFMEKHNSIRLYLDRDTAGQNCSRRALLLSNKYKDESKLYEGYKDFNDWVMNFGKSQKREQRLKPG